MISRGNNDANVMVIGTKVVSDEEATELLALWLAFSLTRSSSARESVMA